MKLAPSAILFDMDGVIVDSLDSWWKALNNALKKEFHRSIANKVSGDRWSEKQQ